MKKFIAAHHYDTYDRGSRQAGKTAQQHQGFTPLKITP